jgi:hypothetical protein
MRSRINQPSPAAKKIRPAVKLAGWAVIALLVILTAELGSYMAGEYYIIPRARYLFYHRPDPGLLTKADYADYLNKRHKVLGWPAPSSFGGEKYDQSGSRWIPAFVEAGGAEVSLYGDSFTYGADVNHQQAWSNTLAKMLGVRVANYGVSGYGVDQAYLRFRERPDDEAGTVVLTIIPDDLKRNLNQQYYFLTPLRHLRFGLKPRFILQNHRLNLIPLPRLDHAAFVDSFSHPQKYLKHEYFIPGSDFGPTDWSFPYTLRILQALLSPQVQSWLADKPGWLAFVQEEHPSGSLDIARLIIKQFADLAQKRGKNFMVVLLPSDYSYKLYLKNGRLFMGPLLDYLHKNHITASDITPKIKDYLGGREYAGILVSRKKGAFHYNPEGNRMLAKMVYEMLLANGFVKR